MPTVVMLGPDPSDPGGIATLERGLLRADLGRFQVRFVVTRRGRRAATLPSQLAAAAGELRRELPAASLAHLHIADGASLLRKGSLARVARRAGVPVVMHANFGRLEPGRRGVRSALRWALAPAHAIIAASTAMADLLAKLDPTLPVRSIPNGVLLGRCPPPPPPGPPRVLFVGALEARKGVFDLADAWPTVRRALPDAELEIVGEGPSPDARRRLAAALGDGAGFRGRLRGPDLRSAYARCDLVCVPSHREGLPLVVLEAMAAGRAVLGTRVDGIPEAIEHGVTGWLVAPRSPAALAETLVTALGDRRSLEAMGERGRAAVEARFGVQAVANELIELWSGLVGR